MHITGTHFNYYQVCSRKLWLFSKGLQMEHNSTLVDEGRFIHETSYPRRSDQMQEIELDGIKIDYFDPKTRIVHEIKKSDKHEDAHVWQLKYYLFILDKNKVQCHGGQLEYPKLRITKQLTLSPDDTQEIEKMLVEIGRIIESDKCPSRLLKNKCKNCSYFDFCWSGEEEFGD